MAKERWKNIDIKPFIHYQVSDHGRIRRFYKGKVNYLKGGFDTNGYHYVKLSFKGTQQNKSVHRLVAKTFIRNPKQKPQVNHKDGDKTNNYFKNLEWATAEEQMNHSYNVLGNKAANGERKKKSSKLTENDVREIRRRAGKISNIELSKIYNISQSYVSDVIRRVTWKHVK